MAKHLAEKGSAAKKTPARRTSTTEDYNVTSMDFSLDDILAEYRVWPEAAPAPEPEETAEPLPLDREENGVYTGELPTEPEPTLDPDLERAFQDEPIEGPVSIPEGSPDAEDEWEEETRPAPVKRPSQTKKRSAPSGRRKPSRPSGAWLPRPSKTPRPSKPAGQAKAERQASPPRRAEQPPAVRAEEPASAYPTRPAWQAPSFDLGDRTITEDEIFSEMFSPEELTPLVLPDSAPEEGVQTQSGGYEDEEDFYAGRTEAAEEPAPAPESDTETVSDADPGEPVVSRRARRGGKTAMAGQNRVLEKTAGLLAAAARRRERNREQPSPEPEDDGEEMAPNKAARHYAAQMPALRLRTFSTALVCLLLIWLTISCRFGGGLPGRLATDIRLASMVALVAQITVLLLGLDVITAGVMSLIRGRPGAESLVAVAMLASALDIIAVAVTGNGERGLPFVAIPCLSVLFALWGGWQTGAAYHDTFLALFHAKEPSVVTSEELPERKGRVLIKSRRDVTGFIRRSEEPSMAETLAESAFLPLVIGSAALALALALGGKDIGAFFHIFGLMTALSASFGWLFSFPVLFAKTARHLLFRGLAVAGWSGARDTGTSVRLVLTDTDIFPEDTVEITGIRLLDKSRARDIISLAGSMLSTAGTGTASVFTELMRRHNAALRQVEDFSVGEGGCKGKIDEKEIRVGTVGYMHLSGVKIPDKLRTETALYIAEDGELSGVFLFRYRPMASIQRALWSLRRERRKPIFAVRDFNLDPMLLKKQFGVSTEGFEFPPFAERYRISGVPAGSTSGVAGVMAEDGLENLVELTECGRQLHTFGRICAWVSLISAVLGAVLMLVPCWTGNWAAASAASVLLYMAVWLLPTLACWVLTRK